MYGTVKLSSMQRVRGRILILLFRKDTTNHLVLTVKDIYKDSQINSVELSVDPEKKKISWFLQ